MAREHLEMATDQERFTKAIGDVALGLQEIGRALERLNRSVAQLAQKPANGGAFYCVPSGEVRRTGGGC